MALVPPQRKSSSPIGEEPACATVMQPELSFRAKRGILAFAGGRQTLPADFTSEDL